MGKNKKKSLTSISTISDNIPLENALKTLEKLDDEGPIPCEKEEEILTIELVKEDSELSQEDCKPAVEEVQSTVEEVKTTVEEVQSTVEEVKTTVEEVKSTVEEVKTTVEEVKSTVEEVDPTKTELLVVEIKTDEKKDDNTVVNVSKNCNRRLCSIL